MRAWGRKAHTTHGGGASNTGREGVASKDRGGKGYGSGGGAKCKKG